VNAPSKVYEFQKRTQKSLLLWFLKRNCWPVSSRIAIAMLVVWLCFWGGGRFLFNRFVGMIQGVTVANSAPKEVKPAEQVQPKPVTDPPQLPHSPTSRTVRGYLPDQVRPLSSDLRTGPVVLPPEREVVKYSIRMLTPKGVVFSDRNAYSIGDIIETGPLKGEQIHEIDYLRRRIRTSKRVLLLGDVIEQVKELPVSSIEKEQSK